MTTRPTIGTAQGLSGAPLFDLRSKLHVRSYEPTFGGCVHPVGASVTGLTRPAGGPLDAGGADGAPGPNP